MKSRILLVALLLSGLPLSAADAVPQFNALLAMGRESRFVLGDQAGETSGWLKLGDVHAGYTLKAFDLATSELELTRDGRSTKVKLRSAAAGGDPAAPVLTPGTVAAANELFRVMRFDEMLIKMADQQKKAMQGALQQSLGQVATRMNLSEAEKAELTAFQQKAINDLMNSAMGPEFRADVAKIYSEVFTQEELNAQAAFYSTPTGQSVVDKSPAAQAKMQELMLPRLMQGSAQMQQSLQEFMRQMVAKRAPTAPAPAAPPAP